MEHQLCQRCSGWQVAHGCRSVEVASPASCENQIVLHCTSDFYVLLQNDLDQTRGSKGSSSFRNDCHIVAAQAIIACVARMWQSFFVKLYNFNMNMTKARPNQIAAILTPLHGTLTMETLNGVVQEIWCET